MRTSNKELRKVLNDPAELRRLRDLNRPKTNGEPDTAAEENMAEWLGRLKLMHGVPFNYIISDVSMLPPESIKFFYCDTIWLDHLVEGALSLGRSTTNYQIHDKVFLDDLHTFSRHGIKTQRKKVLGHLVEHLNERDKALFNTNPISPNEIITGFLLRSEVVRGWEGLQVEAYEDVVQKQDPCPVLRMDHLSPDVLLCLFEGNATYFRIHEYPEVLHFGFDKTTSAEISYTKSFRYPDNSIMDHPAGSEIKEDIAPYLEMRGYERSTAAGVLRMDELAKAMYEELKLPKVGYKGDFTSAQFALEMVQGVEGVSFLIDYTQ